MPETTIATFQDVLKKYRAEAFSQRDKGTRFEAIMTGCLKRGPLYRLLAGK